MKAIIRYYLEGDGSVPKFVEDGGYFKKGEEMIGVSIDSSKRYIPATVHTLTNLELVNWVKSMTNTGKTLEELETIANSWLTEKGFQ